MTYGCKRQVTSSMHSWFATGETYDDCTNSRDEQARAFRRSAIKVLTSARNSKLKGDRLCHFNRSYRLALDYLATSKMFASAEVEVMP